MRPLDTTFDRCGVRANPIDVELIQRPPELRMAWAVNCRRVVDPEDTRLVAVERERRAISLDVRSGRFKVAKRRLGARKVYDYQPAGRIVDVRSAVQTGARSSN